MSEQTSQEPTMEEILASIRRIISEDDGAGGGAEAGPAEPAPAESAAEPEEPVAEAAPVAQAPVPPAVEAMAEPEPLSTPVVDEDDDLELTERVESLGDLDVLLESDDPKPAEPAPIAPAPAPEPAVALVSEHVADAAASAFSQLSAAIAMPKGERTLEDVVRELLRPLLQQWLDQNLPDIVRQAVDVEVERIAHGRGR